HRALGDQLTHLRGGRLVVQRRPRLLERDLGRLGAREAHRQPPIVALADVVAHLQPELVDVEVERLLLVEDVDARDAQSHAHPVFSSSSVATDAPETTEWLGLVASPKLLNRRVTPAARRGRVAAIWKQ